MVEKINNLPPFYVGQKVVYVDDSDYHATAPKIKKGDVVAVAHITKCCCVWVVDVGLTGLGSKSLCRVCKNAAPKPEPKTAHWLHASRFSPIEENFQSITLEKVLEEQTPLVSAN